MSSLTTVLSITVDLLVFLLFATMGASVLALTLGPVLAGGLDAVRRLRSRLRRSPR